jgi:hypothetical protein
MAEVWNILKKHFFQKLIICINFFLKIYIKISYNILINRPPFQQKK